METNKEIAESLQSMADWIEKINFIPDSIDLNPYLDGKPIIKFPCVNTKEEFKQFARLSDKAEKIYKGDWFRLILDYGKFKAEAFQLRDLVCTKRVIGTRLVDKEVPLKTRIIQVEEEIVEWDCEPLLGDAEKADLESKEITESN